MDIPALTEKVDRLETERDDARRAHADALHRFNATERPGLPTADDWRAISRAAREVADSMDFLADAQRRLTLHAELEQALKEERWSDVGTIGEALVEIGEGAPSAEPTPAKLQEMTWVGGGNHPRHCAGDLRARGFKVAMNDTGTSLLVETPAGWTGTPAADVAKAHLVDQIQDQDRPVGDVVFGKLAKCPGVPHRIHQGERTCVVSGGMIGELGQCEVHHGAR